MKKILKILFVIILVFLALSTAFHHVMLKVEQDKIIPNGTIVTVDNHEMHVYSEGDKSNPTLVFMSGSATVAPVYDFKPLYEKLSDDFHIVVVEKAGYGYSEISDTPRDIDTMLYETRQSLILAGEKGPYILLPHSMSGIEALYWAQQYPDEVNAIIGLDMAIPDTYEDFDFKSANRLFSLGKALTFLGLHRTLSFLYPYNDECLNEWETKQQKYLMCKNAVNKNYLEEGKYVYENAMLVQSSGIPDVEMLLFISDGTDIGEYWISTIQDYAENSDTQIIFLDCGHYIHYYESQQMSEQIISFVNNLNEE